MPLWTCSSGRAYVLKGSDGKAWGVQPVHHGLNWVFTGIYS